MPRVRVHLAHHGEALGPDIDPRRPLSANGLAATQRIAEQAAAKGARPLIIWHSGKLRAKQTAEIYWRACNALAEFSASRDLQPDDPPSRMRERLRFQSRDILVAGHFPHLPRLLSLLCRERDREGGEFPANGIVTLVTDDDGETWTEEWRIERSGS
jgi:phosphohistidine phosphatase